MRKPGQEETRNTFLKYERDPSYINLKQLVRDIKAKTASEIIDKLPDGKKLVACGLGYFESEEGFIAWLFRVTFCREAKTPIEYLTEENGTNTVMDWILSLE